MDSRMTRRAFVCCLMAAGLLFVLASPAIARAESCATPPAETAPPLQIVRGMADYKAAIDAGYEACRENYPEQFAEVQDISTLMRENMDAELSQGIAVTARMLASETGDEQHACVDGIRAHVETRIDALYEKAYGRRHRIMSRAGLVPEAQDSCLIVLDAIRNYEDHYRRYRQARHALFEAASKQAKASGVADRAAFRAFEKVRDSVP